MTVRPHANGTAPSDGGAPARGAIHSERGWSESERAEVAAIELRHFRYFVAVAEELHFTRAAARLHMAQSPLSAQVRQLESRLGVALLDRSGGRVSLTAAGAVMLDHARRLLGEVDVAVAVVRATAAGLRGSVRIGVAETVTIEHVVRRRRRAEQLAPELDISIERAACSSMLGRLAQGDFDALAAHGPVHAAGLECTPFATDGFVCLLSRGHRLADRDAVVLDDLRQQRPIYLEGAGPWPFNDYHDDAIIYRTLDDLLIAVAAEEGVAMLPAGAVSARAVSSIRVVPVSDAQPVPVGLLTPAGSASPLVRLLVSFAHD